MWKSTMAISQPEDGVGIAVSHIRGSSPVEAYSLYHMKRAIAVVNHNDESRA
jgi:hypothetical protein